MTVAHLGFAIDSGNASKAASDLDKLTAASSKAQAASEKLSRATKSVDLSKLEAGVGSTNSSLQKLIDLAEQTNVALSKLSRAPAPRLPAAPKIDPKPIVEAGKAAALTSQQMLNLSRQGNDVLTMFAMGASPMQIFASQAGQIYGALEEGPGGLRGSLRAVGEGLLGLITRFPMATAAIAAAGAAMVAYKVFGGQEIKNLDDVLKQHKAAIDSLGPAYHGVLKEVENYAGQSAQVVQLLMESASGEAKKVLTSRIGDAVADMNSLIMKEAAATGQGIASSFEPFFQAIAKLGAGTSTVAEFNNEVARIAASGEGARSVAITLIDLAQEAARTEIAAFGMRTEISEAETAFAALKAAIGGLDAGPAKTELETLRDKIIAGETSVKDITTALTNLSQARPDLSAAIAEIRRLALEAWGASDAVNSVRLSPGGPVGGRVYNKFNELLPGGKGDTRAIPTPSTREDPYLFGAPDKKSGRSAAERAADAYKQLIKSADDRIKQMRTELEYVGQVGVEVDALKNYQELLAKATDRGRTVGEAQQKELRQRAEEMAKLKHAIAEAKAMQDLLFERDQMGRSSIDQLIASTMKGAGLDIDFSSPVADAIRFNEQLRTTRELLEGIASDITSGLRDALADGKLEWRELGDIAMSVLQRIADQMLKMATDSLISGLMEALIAGGKGGSGGGFLRKLFGFDAGGYTGTGGASQVAGVVHGGEYVFSKPATDRLGLGYLDALHKTAKGYRSGGLVRALPPANVNVRGFQSGGYVQAQGGAPSRPVQVEVTVGVAADGNGNLMPFVQKVSQREAAGVVQAAAPGIVKGSVSAVQQTMRNRPGYTR